jgi:hypothetical protein
MGSKLDMWKKATASLENKEIRKVMKTAVKADIKLNTAPALSTIKSRGKNAFENIAANNINTQRLSFIKNDNVRAFTVGMAKNALPGAVGGGIAGGLIETARGGDFTAGVTKGAMLGGAALGGKRFLNASYGTKHASGAIEIASNRGVVKGLVNDVRDVGLRTSRNKRNYLTTTKKQLLKSGKLTKQEASTIFDSSIKKTLDRSKMYGKINTKAVNEQVDLISDAFRSNTKSLNKAGNLAMKDAKVGRNSQNLWTGKEARVGAKILGAGIGLGVPSVALGASRLNSASRQYVLSPVDSSMAG